MIDSKYKKVEKNEARNIETEINASKSLKTPSPILTAQCGENFGFLANLYLEAPLLISDSF